MNRILTLVLPVVLAGSAPLIVCASEPTGPIEVLDTLGRPWLRVAAGQGSAGVHRAGDSTVTGMGSGWTIPEAAKVSSHSDAFKLEDGNGATPGR